MFDTAEPPKECQDHTVDRTGIREPPLLLTCKQVRSEAAPLFYDRSAFYITSDGYDLTVLRRWKRKSQAVQDGYDVSTLDILVFESIERDAPKLLKWARTVHEEELSGSMAYVDSWGTASDAEVSTLTTMLRMFAETAVLDWETVKDIVKDFVEILADVDDGWDTDVFDEEQGA